MAKKQVMIAVSEELRDALKEECRRLETAYDEGWHQSHWYDPSPANPTRPHISISALLKIMLKHRQEHRARRRKAALNRRAKRKKLPSAQSLRDLGAL